ncbi:MAG: ATPase [Sulfurovum sp.]|nr:MAG: ATPase [Sulfurovum sp.]
MNKDKIFEILNDWNFWFNPLPKTYIRKNYEDEIAKKSLAGEVIVIKGVRRSGKSTLLINEIKRLISEGLDVKNILFVNFEDQRFRMFDEQTLLEEIKNVYLEYVKPVGDIVIMLDEVQNIKAWEQWVLKEYELSNNRLYVTGSNSHLLSAEFGTALGGRYLDIEVFPLSFKEYLSFNDMHIDTKAALLHHKMTVQQHFNTYIQFGGFPKTVLLDDESLKKETLKSYYDSILLKDIVARYKLKNYQVLNELALFMLSNNASINAYNKLKNNFSSSFDTIRDYMEYLMNAYIILSINKFDYSLKKQIANPKKFYAIDTGFSNAVSFNVSKKIGANLENIVFLELRRRGEEIYYYKSEKGLEIDFLVPKENVTELIQVSVTLENEETRKRELRVFKEAKKELRGALKMMLITFDSSENIVYDDVEIQIVNILEFLLFSS